MSSRRWTVLLAGIVVVLAVVGLGAWWFNRPDPVPDKAPASAPAVGSCWQVAPTAAKAAFPWQAASASCTGTHTAEVYYVGQADHDLVRQARGTDDNAKIAANLMLAEVRRACGSFASVYLGDSWHGAQVTILADWIAPQRDGFFGCALAQTADGAGTTFVARTASLKSAAASVAATCALDGTYLACDEPHNSEFVGTYTVTPPDAPYDAAGVTSTVSRGCGDAIRSYLGLAAGAQRSDLTVGYVGPANAQTWLGSDQVFACYAVSSIHIRGTIRSLGTRPLPH